MQKKWKWWYAILIVAGIVIIGYNWLIIAYEDYYSEFSPSFSAAEAKRDGVYVSSIDIQPKTIQWQDKTMTFQDVWAERVTKMTHKFLLFPNRIDLGRYRVCFTLDNVGPSLSPSGPFFAIEGTGRSFGMMGAQKAKNPPISYVFCDEMDHAPKFFKASLINDWHGERKNDISFTPQ